MKQNPIAVKVKIADSSHNLSKAHLIDDQKKQDFLRNKYITVLDALGKNGSECEKPIIYNNGKWLEKKNP